MLLPPGASAECAAFVAEICRRLSAKAAAPPPHADQNDPLPYEFVVLDAALEAACAALEHATCELERDTPRALDALGATIDAATLERVRRLKGFISRDVGRAAAVRGEILRFLDDDSDMRGMYLTRKAAERRHAAGMRGSGRDSGGVSGFVSGFGSGLASPAGARLTTPMGAGLRSPARQWSTLVHAPGAGGTHHRTGRASGRASGLATPTRRDRGGAMTPHALPAAVPERRDSFGSGADGAASLALALERLDEDADVQALEDILETYFAQLDRTCARLNALEELVAQTEDYVNIDLDSKRNVLIEIMLVTAFVMTVSLCYTTITGAFGT